MITHESSLENFTEQFEYVLENYKSHGLKAENFSNIVICGLGGSGIGGVIAKNWFFDQSTIPIETVADYHLPKYTSEKSLVILNSYSGNTEETLSTYAEAKANGCKIITITGGGTLKELSNSDSQVSYPLKGGYQPRMTIGLGLTYILLIIGEALGQDLRPEIEGLVTKFKADKETLRESGAGIFDFFKGTIKNKFVIVADRQFAPVATRFTQQLQENSKLEGFVSVLPEANHNMIESYVEKLPTNYIMLYSTENQRVAARFDFLISHLEMENSKVLPLQIPEYNLYSIFNVIYILDWVSVDAANELGSDLMNVPIIMNLKGFLADLEIVHEEGE
ncbi:SIS domain-containing protein [Bacteroidia bacterium]|nr:SIS domain-containing protein [Bacteroidia bacterium]MDB9883317.1 SIS domain-containing protein [Bacteroidia bacterium]MDC1395774.1 SIS domain-containing protein [Bacteroidia bacterium]